MSKPFFLNQREQQAQSFRLEGLEINVPQGSTPLTETCEVSIAIIVDDFEFPAGTSLASLIYVVSVSKALPQLLQLSIQHYPTQEHLSFVIADPYHFPYQFQLVQEGKFLSGCNYGSIDFTFTQFSAVIVIAIVVATPVR